MATGVVKGPWSEEEDEKLLSYVRKYGHGHWETLALKAGLQRTGKSCRLRWLNYLRPGVRRGNISPQEQLTILQLHSRWGNRWAKIAECLPGRSDNEIKNYWRTRVQKQAKQLHCDVNSCKFREIMHNIWIPQLEERLVQPNIESSQAMAVDNISNQSKPDQVKETDPSMSCQVSRQPSCHFNDTLNLASALHGEGVLVDDHTYGYQICNKMIPSEDFCWINQGLEADHQHDEELELTNNAWFEQDSYCLENLLNDEEMLLSCQF